MRLRTSAHPFTREVGADLHVPDDGGDGSLVVALHGMGMQPASFACDVLSALPPRAAALLPQAPYPYEIRGGSGPPREGFAWYVYSGDGDAFLLELERSERWLLAVIDDVVRREGFDPSRTALLGFSQGGYLAGFVGVRHAVRFRALVVAGGRIKDEVLGDAARAAAAAAPSFRVLHVHGAADEAVRPDPSRASVERISAWGVAARFRSYTCGHAVLRDAACRADVAEFLGDALR